ncbi:uncharacterized protein LOC110249057 [Exaiptasia diaphana]|uniref:Uncharacterized protein n=1 Tax=Exaiptasia diaphana TaxID=2652724 RepID=A0A913XXC3_EXADI|nr:uncharacterized protein LOC110249057 [Exaiptasia diaphana]
MRYVVVILFIVAVCVFCNALPNKCPKHPPCRPYGGCRIRKWRRVTSSMVHSTYRIGVALSYSQVRGGLRITGNVYHNGCGKGAGSGAVTYIKGDWTYIRYTQEFRGAASCWKIFGGPASPKYRYYKFYLPNICQ